MAADMATLTSMGALLTKAGLKKLGSQRFSYPRKSYYFTREFTPNSPRKSNFRTSQTKLDNNKKPNSSSYSSVVSATCSCRAMTIKSSDSPLPPPDYSASSSDSFRSDRILPTESFDKMVSWSSSDKITADDIIINVDSKSLATNFEKLNLSDRDLPPIITKPVEMKKKKETVEKPKSRINSSRRQVSSPGLRLRVNSPRIGSRRIGGGSGGRKSVSSCSRSSYRRSLSDSVAIVKASVDPQGDFRESMVEMIEGLTANSLIRNIIEGLTTNNHGDFSSIPCPLLTYNIHPSSGRPLDIRL